MSGRSLSPAEVEQRRSAGVRHGARSEGRIRPVAARLRRQVLRQLGVRVGELDPVSRGYLELYARSLAKVRLYDAWLDQHGLVDDEGNSPGFMSAYYAAVNSARLALSKLEDRLTAAGLREADDLAGLKAAGRAVIEARVVSGNGAGS